MNFHAIILIFGRTFFWNSSLLLLVTTLVGSSTAALARDLPYTGKYQLAVLEGEKATAKEYLLLPNGKRLILKIPKKLKNPLTVGERAKFIGQKKGNTLLVKKIKRNANRRSVAAKAPLTGRRKIAAFLVQFRDSQPNCTKEVVDSALFSGPNSARQIIEQGSYGKLSFNADGNQDGQTDIFTISLNRNKDEILPNGTCGSFGWLGPINSEIQRQGINLSLYDHQIYVMPSGVYCEGYLSGLALIEGDIILIAPNACRNGWVYAHELGHNFGMQHSSSDLNNAGNVEEYGDYTCAMGNQSDVNNFNASHKEEMGWIDSSEVLTTATSGTYVLKSLDNGSSGQRVLRVALPASEEYLYLSYRTSGSNLDPLQFKFKTSIHRYKPKTSRSFLVRVLGDNEVFIDPVNGIIVSQIGRDSNSVTVDVKLNVQVATTPEIGRVKVAADNMHWTYFNGDLVGEGSKWQVAIDSPVKIRYGKNVLAIKAANIGGVAGLLAEITRASGRMGSNASWKITKTAPPSHWIQPNFDDSQWDYATELAPYGHGIWSMYSIVANMPTDTPAQWIWSSDHSDFDTVYVRVSFNRDVAFSNPVPTATATSIPTAMPTSVPTAVPTSIPTATATATPEPTASQPVNGTLKVSADNSYTAFFNGAHLGSGSSWENAQTYNIQVQSGKNVVAVKAEDAGGIAAMIAELQAGSRRLGTSGQWKVSRVLTQGWEQPNFDDSSWANATHYAAYGQGIWGTVSQVANMPSDTSAHWIWSSDNNADDKIYFRFSFNGNESTTPNPQPPAIPTVSGTLTISADNSYTAFFNSVSLGSGGSWQDAQTYTVSIQTGKNVIAVDAQDAGGIAALIADLRANTLRYGTDGQWKVSKVFTPGWEQASFDDSSWMNATDYAAYGQGIWGTVSSVNNMPNDTLAHWIWTSDNNTDDRVYFRFSFNN